MLRLRTPDGICIELIEKIIDEDVEILHPLPQRRETQYAHRQPVK